MVTWLLLGIGLYYLQVFTPSTFKMTKMGVWKYMGNRENDPDLSGMASRLERATNNMKENFPVFAALAVALIAVGEGDNSAALVGAQMFVLLRLAFMLLYAAGVPVLRSIAMTGALIGLGVMAITLIDKTGIV